MTVLDAPPLDNAPRLASAEPEDFPVPHGREEEWRFAPVAELAFLMQADAQSGDLVADEAPYVRVVDLDPADAGHWLPTDRASAIARASTRRSVRVDVPADTVVAEPIVVRLTADRQRAHGHLDIRIGRGSRATVVVVHDASVDTSGALVTQVDDDATLTMLSLLEGSVEHAHIWHWPTQVGRNATFTGSTITIGGRIVRLLPSVSYAGPGGSATMLGAFLADDGQFVEHRTLVEHIAPHCSSHVAYKGALSGTGTRTVWVGDVIVRRAAIGTETYEMNRNLVLDDGARADSVPNLELETGDVASAGHASATGRFDDQQLFYLEARGIPERIARQLVVRGFFVDVLARIDSDEWREIVLQRIAQRLGMDPELERGLEGIE